MFEIFKIKMVKKIFIVHILFLALFTTTVSFADEIELDDFLENEVWEEIEEVNKSSENKEPMLNSRAAIVFDRCSKSIVYGKNIDSKRAMASTTKIMTAILALEKGNLSDVVEIGLKAANTGGSRLGLKNKDRITLRDLLYGLMLRSGNDAAVQIAIQIAGSIEDFAKMMNEKAQELGLKNTNFVTPHGLDDQKHYTTAYELAILTDYALNIKEFAKIVNTKTTTISINGIPRTINNTNELLGYLSGVNGVKTGFTNNAGRCLVTSVTRNNWSIITIVLGADTKKHRTKDSIELIEYTFKNYKQINIKEIIEEKFQEWKSNFNLKIIKGTKKKVDLKTKYDYGYELYPIKLEKEGDIKVQIEAEDIFRAPIEINTEIGRIHVVLEDKEIMTIPILTSEKIEMKKPKEYFFDIIKNYTKQLEKIVVAVRS